MISIYILTDPTGAATAYVGATKHPMIRLAEHIEGRDKSPRNQCGQWIAGLRHQGLEPVLTVLDVVPPAEVRQAARIWWAQAVGRRTVGHPVVACSLMVDTPALKLKTPAPNLPSATAIYYSKDSIQELLGALGWQEVEERCPPSQKIFWEGTTIPITEPRP
jgi:hypothetical protein